MKKLIWIILIGMLVPETSFSQKITQEEHLKYWYYRHRLVEEFVIVGEAENFCDTLCSGLSIPAQSVNQWGGVGATSLKMSWVENPAQGLGRYIGVLATELKLLYLSGESFENTQMELYYALKAYERIDYNCECLFYPEDENGNLNGLFGRDDVPLRFLDNHTSFKQKNNYHYNIGSTYVGYYKKNGNPHEDNFYPSMEEWAGLVTGFALVVKALADCPAEVVIYDGYRFIDEAIRHTQRFMDRYKNNDWEGLLPDGSPYTYSTEPKYGQQLYGLAKVADFICQYGPFTVPLQISAFRHYAQGMDYHDATTSLELAAYLTHLGLTLQGEAIINVLFLQKPTITVEAPRFLTEDFQQYCWMKLGNPTSTIMAFPGVGLYINNFFLEGPGNPWVATTNYTYAAIGNSWRNRSGDDITFGALATYTQNRNWEYFPLLNLYLHSKNMEVDQMRKNMINHLKIAPVRGPHFLPYFHEPSTGMPGWRAGYKWGANPDEAENGPVIDLTDGNKANGGKYPGLDYMLAYNLLWLECLQQGVEDSYMEVLYTNERDKKYSTFSSTNEIVLYKYGHLLVDTYLSNDQNYSFKIIGESINIEGPVDLETSGEIHISTKPKVSLVDIFDN